MPAENNQKIDPLLRTALDATAEEFSKSQELSTGFSPEEKRWELIIRYAGEFSGIAEAIPGMDFTPLMNGYAVLDVPESALDVLANLPQVIYIEKPKRLFFETISGRRASCISTLQNDNPEGFTGQGVIVGIIDSGIDFAHPDFCNADGTTRLLGIWDQTVFPEEDKGFLPPEGFLLGTYFDENTINEALKAPTFLDREAICPSRDLSGHGTHVAGIAAGNGRASLGVNRGIAYEARLLAVKLGSPKPQGFPSTTQLMQGVDFCIRESLRYNMPLALNISFGNTYGPHSGTSLLESYLDSVAENGRCSIVVGSGNEGSSGGHTGGNLRVLETMRTLSVSEALATPEVWAVPRALTTPETSTVPDILPSQTSMKSMENLNSQNSNQVELAVAEYSTGLSLQIWKNYGDEISLTLDGPTPDAPVFVRSTPGISRYTTGNTELLISYGEPAPYNIYQEIYIDFIPKKSYLDAGIWTITLIPGNLQSGEWEMWLPSAAVRGEATRFLTPTPDVTLTIPSTAAHVITVGAYDAATGSPAAFSGRGYTWNTRQLKPDLVAPGVDVTSCAPGGGYTARTGTSMATPFVTGSAALLMQWGIVNGNDPFLYGEKLKAYLRSGAKPFPGFSEYPNPQVGWGTLCLRDSLPRY